MSLISFSAVEQKVRNDIPDLGELLPAVLSAEKLAKVQDAEILSLMSRRIFRAGLRASMVDAKWPAFEQAFYGFNPLQCSMMSDDDIDMRMENTAIIRHLRKIQSIRTNAAMMVLQAKKSGSFSRFVADWPSNQIVDLWFWLKKEGAQLGGNSGPYFLRMLGKDTFLLTGDVVNFLIQKKIVSKQPTSRKDLVFVQQVFNHWHEESGLPLSHISRMVSFYY